jgi:hypothetical protein
MDGEGQVGPLTTYTDCMLPLHQEARLTPCCRRRKLSFIIVVIVIVIDFNKWQEVGENCTIHNLYSSPDISRMLKTKRMRWAGHVAHMGEKRNTYRILMGKAEGKRPLGRWVDNIKMDLKRDRMR